MKDFQKNHSPLQKDPSPRFMQEIFRASRARWVWSVGLEGCPVCAFSDQSEPTIGSLTSGLGQHLDGQFTDQAEKTQVE